MISVVFELITECDIVSSLVYNLELLYQIEQKPSRHLTNYLG